MPHSFSFDVDFVEPTHPLPSGGLWTADATIAASDAIAERNRAIAERLGERLPGLAADAGLRNELSAFIEDGLSAEAALRRYHRSRMLSGHWPSGHVLIRLFDGVAIVTVVIVDIGSKVEQAAFAHGLAALLESIAEATGYVPLHPATRDALAPRDAADVLIRRNARGLGTLARTVRKHRLYLALGLPSAILLTLLALAASGALFVQAVSRGSMLARVDPARTLTFVTAALPAPTGFHGFFPGFALDGYVAETGERTRLVVFRDQYLRAGAGARFPVHPSTDPAAPYMLKAAFEAADPVIRIGRYGVQWHAVLALLLLAVWAWFLARPWLLAPIERRPVLAAQATQMLITLATIAAAIVVIVAARIFL